MRLFRRILSSVNLLVLLACLFSLFIFINYIANRRYTRMDFTKQKISRLSDRTLEILKTLDGPVKVIVFYQPSHRLFQLVKDQMDEYAHQSERIKVEYLDPDQDLARAKQLVQEFQIQDTNIVVISSGTRHKYLSDTDLADYDVSSMQFGGEMRVAAFKGEDAITSAILSVTQATSPLVWVTTGHGEKSIDVEEGAGASTFKKALEQQNLLVQSATLAEHVTVPADVKAIVIAGPTHRFSDAEIKLLGEYFDQGGRALILLDPMTDTGLEPLLLKWGVALSQDIVVDPRARIPFVSAANLLVATYTDHPIVAKMKTLLTMFPLARSVRPVESEPEGVTVTSLAMTSPDGWGETQTSTETFEKGDQDIPGPVAVAVAIERELPQKTRLVVIGDSEFMMDAQIDNAGNRDFTLGAMFWLTEQERLIGIGPKVVQHTKLNLTAQQLTGVFWFSFLGLPLFCGLLGAAVWWVRRT